MEKRTYLRLKRSALPSRVLNLGTLVAEVASTWALARSPNLLSIRPSPSQRGAPPTSLSNACWQVISKFTLKFTKLTDITQDDLQIPSTVRVKLTTLETPVKAAMLRSSHVLGTVPAAPATPPSLRRTRSNESLGSPKPLFALGSTNAASNEDLVAPRPAFLMDEPSRSSLGSSKDVFTPPASPSRHARGSSLDLPRTISVTDLTNPKGKKDKSKDAKELDKFKPKDKVAGAKEKEREIISPQKFCQILSKSKTVELDVSVIKKLRIMLRNEAARYALYACIQRVYDLIIVFFKLVRGFSQNGWIFSSHVAFTRTPRNGMEVRSSILINPQD